MNEVVTRFARGQLPLLASAVVLISLAGQNLGSALAKSLFPVLGVYGVVGLRVALAAAMLMALRRPWRHMPARDALPMLAGYGAALGLMNLTIYLAFARLPIGIAVAIEVLGPLAVVLWGSRTRRDFLWLALAVAGLGLLLPLHTEAALDPVGLLLAIGAAACWALYIVYGKRVSARLDGDAVAWGLLVAALINLPLAAATVGTTLLTPWVLGVGLLVAILSSALPYSLEMAAMRHLPRHVFGILLASAPAVAAVAGWLVLDERLSPLQWLSVALIMLASGGSALSVSRPMKAMV